MSAERDESATRPFGVSSSDETEKPNTRPTLPLPTELMSESSGDDSVTGDSPATRISPRESHEQTPFIEGRSSPLWETVEAAGEFQPGQVIFGRYVVQGKLGKGGMGTVWLVTHRELNTDRAIKLIVAGISYDTQARARFRREAQVMASFSHPNAVIVHDARLTEQDVAFIDMEYVQGKSLDKLIQRGHPMPLDWITRIIDQLCDVLQVAHDNGIVHRDLKPANLMTLDGRPYGKEHLKVLDFGIAKILREAETEGGPSTMTGVFMGTPPYASPEQADGKADTRSDIYALGVILYEFLTGFRPFSGPASRMLVETITSPPPSFATINPEVSYPPGVEALVMRCLAKNPEDRPQTTRQVAEEFHACLPHLKPAAPDKVETAPGSRVWLPVGATALVLISLLAWWNYPSETGASNTTKTVVTLSNAMPLPEGYVVDPNGKLDEKGLPMTIVPVGPLADQGLRMILLKGGEMRLGLAPLAVDDVEPFAISETEVTNGQMMTYFKERNVKPPKEFEDAYQKLLNNPEAPVSEVNAARHPAVGIPKSMAEDFARWAGGALPTERQWAYAARSGGEPKRMFVWPDNEPTIADGGRANIDTMTSIPTRTTKVMNYPDDRTDQGVYDMTGNVREWCRDSGRTKEESVVRGGSFNSFAMGFSLFKPDYVRSDEKLDDLGFRIVIDPAQPDAS